MYDEKKILKSSLISFIGVVLILICFYFYAKYNENNVRNNGVKVKGIVTRSYIDNKSNVVCEVTYVVDNKRYTISNFVDGYLRENNLSIPNGSIVIVSYIPDNPSYGLIDFTEDIMLPDSTYINVFNM